MTAQPYHPDECVQQALAMFAESNRNTARCVPAECVASNIARELRTIFARLGHVEEAILIAQAEMNPEDSERALAVLKMASEYIAETSAQFDRLAGSTLWALELGLLITRRDA